MTSSRMWLVGLAFIATPMIGASLARAADDDAQFLKEAASGGMMEVELGRAATTRASHDRVREFGKRMVDDHGKANAELKQVAAKESVDLPATMLPKHQEMVKELSSLKGDDFDRAYMKMMVEDHEEDVEKFREQAKAAADPDVKAFAAKTLPTLEKYLQLAKDVSHSVANDGGRRSALE